MTEIQWTDATWNPAIGCSRVSAGCMNCYAERVAHRGMAKQHKGLTGEVRFVPEKLAEPLNWRKPRKVFVNSMSDLFHEKLSNEQIAAVFGVMAACPQHTFQVLTKRPLRALEWFRWIKEDRPVGPGIPWGGISSIQTVWLGVKDNSEPVWAARSFAEPLVGRRLDITAACEARVPWPLPNVWLGVSCENQEAADERIPLLLQTPAAVRFVSAEPLLGRVDFSRVGLRRTDDGTGMQSWEKTDALNGSRFTQTWGGPWFWNGLRGPRIDWVICGGESGPGARPCDVQWIRGIVEQCREAGVPCFVKQLGANPVLFDSKAWSFSARDGFQDGASVTLKLKSSKGGDMAEWPEDLRVRQWPEVRHG